MTVRQAASDTAGEAPEARPFIFVLAGVNGAGKSSVGGALLADVGLTWFNPDTMARALRADFGLEPSEANSRAWQYGHDKLVAAIKNGTNYAFETTLGGVTMTQLIAQAAETHNVIMMFCGLDSAERHMDRVSARVKSGGHDIPGAKILERWHTSRANLIALLPLLKQLQVFDNSAEAAVGDDIPEPVLVLEMRDGEVIWPQADNIEALWRTPQWAKAIVEAALGPLR